MAIFDAQEPEGQESDGVDQQDGKIDWGIVVLILVALPIIIFPFFTDKTELLIGVSFSTAMNVLAIGKCWDLKRYVWFWVIISLIMALHVCLAFLGHWPRVTITKLTLLGIHLTQVDPTCSVRGHGRGLSADPSGA